MVKFVDLALRRGNAFLLLGPIVNHFHFIPSLQVADGKAETAHRQRAMVDMRIKELKEAAEAKGLALGSKS